MSSSSDVVDAAVAVAVAAAVGCRRRTIADLLSLVYSY